MTKRPENRLMPASAIAAMLLAATLIVGLAYWVGDSIAPDLAALIQVTSEEAAAAPAPASGAVERAAGIRVLVRTPAEAPGR